MSYNTPLGKTIYKLKPIGDNCEFISGYAFKGKDFSDVGYPIIKIKNIQDGIVRTDVSEYIPYKIITPKLDKFKLDHNDILIAMTGQGSVGRVGKLVINIGEIAYLNQRVGKFVSDEKHLNNSYLYYIISSKGYEKLLFDAGTGSGQPNLSPNIIKSIEIPFPPYQIQKKIAHILSTLDDKIELNRKMNQTLEEMAQALFKSWFVDFDPVHAKAKCSSDEELETAACELGISKEILELFPSEFEESELGMIPKGWEVKILEDICDFQNGYSFTSKELHDNPTNSIKVFKMGHIHRGGGFKEEGKDTYFTIIDQKKMDKYFLKKGDLLMAMTDMKANMALLAHTALMPHTDQYLLNQRVGRLRAKKDLKVSYPYLYIFSNYPDTINDLRSRSNSGVQVNLTTKAILETKILISSDSLLEIFNSLTETMFEKMFINDAEIVSLQKTRDTLLPKLLSGELDVSELDLKV